MKRFSALVLTTAALLAGVVAVAGRNDATEAAIRDGGPNLAVVIQANRYSVRPGQPVSFAAGFWNRSDETMRLRLSCAPPVDFEVRGPDGGVVWSKSSECNSDDRLLTLAPGAQRLWDVEWPGREGLGEFTVYAVLHTLPRDAVAGPLTITVSEGGEPDPTERPRETDMPRPTERPRETDEPRPTEGPRPTSAVDFPNDIFPVANRDATEREPDVDGRREGADCQDLVVWLDEVQHGILGRFVAGAWRGEAFRISGEDDPASVAKVAYNEMRRTWLVVWSSRRDAGDLEVRARYVQCDGTEGAVFTVGTSSADDSMPAVAAAGEAFGVTWLRSGGDQRALRAARVVGLDTTGEREVADGAVLGEPAVACRNGNACFVVWTVGVEGGRNIQGRRWRIADAQMDSFLEVANAEAAEFDPSIAAGDGDRPYLVTWTRAGDATRVWARRIHASGEIVTGEAFAVSGEGSAVQGDVSAAADGFNVVWSDRTTESATVRGRHVQVGEAVQLGAIQTISDPTSPFDYYPAAVSTANRVALAVWQAGGDDNGDILGRFVRWPGGDAPSRVALFGRVTGGGLAVLSAGHINVDVERVVDGSFACAQARVDYDTETALPVELKTGDHVYVVGDALPGAPPCALTVSAPGTMIMSLGPIRVFTPLIVKSLR
jgi:hypothetical protein